MTKKPKTIKVLIVEPGKNPELKEIESSLESMQKIVGGYIEQVRLPSGGSLVMNEEGKRKNLPLNRAIPELQDIIRGTFFIASARLGSLSPKQIEVYTARFTFIE